MIHKKRVQPMVLGPRMGMVKWQRFACLVPVSCVRPWKTDVRGGKRCIVSVMKTSNV